MPDIFMKDQMTMVYVDSTQFFEGFTSIPTA